VDKDFIVHWLEVELFLQILDSLKLKIDKTSKLEQFKKHREVNTEHYPNKKQQD